MRPHSFLVEYYITLAMDSHGEFSRDQIVEKHSLISVTNDLLEIFTDLFDLHRSSDLLGIEIIGVSEVTPEVCPEEALVACCL